MEAVDGRGVRLTPPATYTLSPYGGGIRIRREAGEDNQRGGGGCTENLEKASNTKNSFYICICIEYIIHVTGTCFT